MPYPADRIFPTCDDCLGYEWMHGPSLYHTLRLHGGIPGTPKGPPLHVFRGLVEPKGPELTKIIIENSKKNGLIPSSSSTADTRRESPRKRRRRSKQPEMRKKGFNAGEERRGDLINGRDGRHLPEDGQSDEDLPGYSLRESTVAISLGCIEWHVDG